MSLSLSAYFAATVAYADIFDYPLTQQERRLWCIKKRIQPTHQVTRQFFFLPGRSITVSVRKKRQSASKKKWDIARNVGKWLRYIPGIQLVGVTGGLAMNNARPEDDIDLFIITSKHTLWITRMLSVMLVGALGRRRTPGANEVADKVCLNMFMSVGALRIATKEQDLFAAHEVLQMKPLWEREGTYTLFLEKNKWVERFLPNAWDEKVKNNEARVTSKKRNSLFFLLEPFARWIQLWYMRKRRTSEVVSHEILRFHPQDARVWVKKELQKRLDTLNIPLDKIFYAR